MKKPSICIFLLLWSSLFGLSCGSSSNESAAPNNSPKVVQHFNIMIVPDLSNRINSKIYPRQLSDQEIIQKVVELFPSCFKQGGRLINQKDKLSLRLINQKEVPNFPELEKGLTIDLGDFGIKQRERIDFINNKDAGNSLARSTTLFSQNVKHLYAEVGNHTYGADIWTFFNQTFDETYLQLTNPFDKPKIKDKSRNILILLTDGYIEAGNYGSTHCRQNKCYFLDRHIVEKFRKVHAASGAGNLEETFQEHGYGIIPADNPALREVEVLALEFYDRSKSPSGSATKYPTDFEITSMFWEDYFKNSGIRKYKVVETRSSIQDIELILKNFLFKSE